MHTSSYEAVFALFWEVLLTLFAYGLALIVNELLTGEVKNQEEKFAKAFRSVPTRCYSREPTAGR